MKTLSILLFLFASLAGIPHGWGSNIAANTSQMDSSVIKMAIEIRQLYIPVEDPQLFVARFDMSFWWDPKKNPNFDPDKIIFLNAPNQPSVQEIPQKQGTDGMRLSSRLYEGRFTTVNDSRGFPLDSHLLAILFQFPEKPEMTAPLVVDPGDIEASAIAMSQEQLAIQLVEFQSGQLYGTPNAKTAAFNSSHGPAHAIVINAAREGSGPALIIWVPILVVWIVSYTGLWWKSDGAVSRASASALFTAVGLSLATMALRPHGDIIDGAILSFILLYINIVIILLMSLVAHRYRARDHLTAYRNIRSVGRYIIAPIMLITSVSLVIWWCSESGLSNEIEEFYSHFKVSLYPLQNNAN